MGSDKRFDYSVLGDAVNLAARLECQTRTYGIGIVVGDRTRAQADGLPFLELDLITAKGKTVSERIHALLGGEELATTEAFSTLTARQEEMLAAYRSGDWRAAKEAAKAARAAADEAGLGLGRSTIFSRTGSRTTPRNRRPRTGAACSSRRRRASRGFPQTTLMVMPPTPSMWPSITSPATIGPTPAGVPE